LGSVLDPAAKGLRVSGGWGSLLGELMPLAMVVAASPLSIIPALLLVLHSARPRPTGLAFMAGWLIGLIAMTAVFVAVPRAFGGTDQATSGWGAWVRIAIGILLIGFGGWRWVTRHKASRAPAFFTTLGKIGPGRAAALGLVLTFINPKLLLLNAAAGLAISTADLGAPGTWLAIAVYAISAGSTVLVPMLAYGVAAHRLDGPLERIREWIELKHAALTAAVLAVFGLLLLCQGLRAL
jgi:threonine/homoserine/homoserine lactone efflux protein